MCSGCKKLSQQEISVNELKQEIKNSQPLVIIDVRTPAELDGPLGKIDGVINIPIDELEKRIHELDKFKNSEFAVICKSGKRSAVGTALLNKNGFHARNVIGGMLSFREKH